MRKLLPTLALAGFTCFTFSTAVSAQDKTLDTATRGGYEGIFIKRNNNKDTKITIEIKDGKVLVNGEQLEGGHKELGDVSVFAHKRPEGMARGGMMSHGGMMGHGGMMAPQVHMDVRPGKVMLGVLTEKKEAAGATVKIVAPNSAAEKAGLKVGDVITKIDADKIEEPKEVFEKIGKHEPGDKVTITYLRDNKEAAATVALEERKGMGMMEMHGHGGFNGRGGNGYGGGFNGRGGFGGGYGYGGGFNGRGGFGGGYHGGFYGRGGFGRHGFHHHHRDSSEVKLGLSAQDTQDGGVQVLAVKAGSAAEKAGFKQGDVVTAIDGKPVKSTRGLTMLYYMNKNKGKMNAEVKRAGQAKTLEIQVPKKLNKVEL